MKKIVVIDGYSLLFRAYYATAYKGEDSILKTSYGTPINAVFTFANMLFPILSKLNKNDGIFVALDTGHKTKRHEIMPSYKANRTEVPEALVIQMPMLREFLDALNIFHYEQIGFEADDIAGTIAKKAEKNGYSVEIFTSDHDYLQLVDKNIEVNLIKKGIKDVINENADNFYELNHFKPEQIPDYKGLRGDSSDNLKGIPGIGDVTAINLLNTYNSLEDVIAHSDELKGKLKENILKYKDDGLLCKKLAEIDTDIELPFDISSLEYQGYKFKNINDFIKKYETKSLTNKLLKIKEYKETEQTSFDFEETKFDEQSSCSSLKESEYLSFVMDYDYSNYHTAKINGFSISNGKNTIYITYKDALNDNYFKSLLIDEKIKKLFFDYKAFYYVMLKNNIEVTLPYLDLIIAPYMIDSNITSDVKTIFMYFDKQIPQKLDDMQLANLIANHLYSLKEKAINILSQKDLYKLYVDVEIPLSKVLTHMEYEGFPIDKNTLLKLKSEYESNIAELTKQIYDIAGKEFNISSPNQLKEVLQDILKLSPSEIKTTSIDLLKHYEDNTFVALIIQYRKYVKLLSTYINGLLSEIYPDDKIHCIFNQTATTTGRLSASEPNLQNIAVRDEESKYIRKAFFYKDSNYVILSFDYSQIELRMLAHIAKCKNLQQAFIDDDDIHTATAKYVFGVNKVTPQQRRKAKAVNFGIVYGISDYGLKEQIGVDINEAKDIIDKFYASYPEVKTYANKTIQDLEKNGYVKTIFGRIRYIPEIFDSNFHKREFAKRAAINVPIQGSSADLIKIAMIKIYKLLENYDTKMVLQIHDELLFKLNVKEIDTLVPKIKNIMETIVKLDVPLKVDGGYARNWYDLK